MCVRGSWINTLFWNVVIKSSELFIHETAWLNLFFFGVLLLFPSLFFETTFTRQETSAYWTLLEFTCKTSWVCLLCVCMLCLPMRQTTPGPSDFKPHACVTSQLCGSVAPHPGRPGSDGLPRGLGLCRGRTCFASRLRGSRQAWEIHVPAQPHAVYEPPVHTASWQETQFPAPGVSFREPLTRLLASPEQDWEGKEERAGWGSPSPCGQSPSDTQLLCHIWFLKDSRRVSSTLKGPNPSRQATGNRFRGCPPVCVYVCVCVRTRVHMWTCALKGTVG